VLDNGDAVNETLTAVGDLTTYREQDFPTGARNSVTTAAWGAEKSFARSADGLRENESFACGMEQEYIYAVDSEYKFKYAAKVIERTPAGLQRISQKSKSYSDQNADGLPDLTIEQRTVNGKQSRIVNDTLASQTTLTTPEGRNIISSYDPDTLSITRLQIAGLYDTIMDYDTQGRIKTITRDTRQATFDYVDDQTGHQITLTEFSGPQSFQTGYWIEALDRLRLIRRPD
jgi:hypothetical protein